MCSKLVQFSFVRCDWFLNFTGAIYENAVILILKIKDREAFERSLCQLKEFYINTWFVSPTTIDFMIHPCQAMFSCYFNI